MNPTLPNINRSIIKKNDGFLAYFFSAQIAYWIVRLTSRTNITPNTFTLLSLILGISAAVAASTGVYAYTLLGIGLLHVSFIFDCCDGQLARAKNLSSTCGHWFDYHSDKLKDIALLLGFAIGYTRLDHAHSWILIVAFIAIAFQFLRNIASLNRDIFALKATGRTDSARSLVVTSGQSQLITTLKNSSLFKLSDRVLLYTVFGALHKIEIGIILYACVDVFYSFASAYINYVTFYKHDKKNA